MPKRKSRVQQIPTPEAQGDDSWVEIRRMSWGEIKALLKRSNRGDEEEKLAANEEMVKKYVLSWNWVDDDDSPLPFPSNGGLDELTDQEFRYLVDLVTGELERKK